MIVGNRNSKRYQTEILHTAVVPDIDTHPIQNHYSEDNARPHHTSALVDYPHQEAMTTISWPAMRPYMSPIDYIMD